MIRTIRRLVLAAVTALACTALLVPATLRPAKAGADALAFSPSGIDGGGMTNVVAADPFHAGVYLAGQDTSGLWRTTDYGEHWTPVDLPSTPEESLFTDPSALRVQAIMFSPKTENFVYAALGNAGTRASWGVTAGGFAVSTDGGQTWHLASSTPHFQVPSGPSYYSDPTGRLIAVDSDSGQLYVATYDQGVMRSDDGGATWNTIALSGQHLRSITLDPQDPSVLYGAVLAGGTGDDPIGGKIWKITGANGAYADAEELPNSPDVAQDVMFAGNRLYAAGGYDGIFSSDDGGSTWTQNYTPDYQTSDMSWDCLAASGDTVFAGSGHSRGQQYETDLHPSVIRSTDDGQTWTSITADPSRIHFTEAGTENPWWHNEPLDAPGGNRYAASVLALDPFDSNRLFLAGKSGIWRTDNDADPAPDWYAAVHGLNVTFNWDVEVDPNDPQRVYVGDTDWSFFASPDGMSTVQQSRPYQQSGVFENVYDIALDPTDVSADGHSRVYAATQAVGDAPGDLYTNPDPVADPTAWTGLGLSEAVQSYCGSYEDTIGVSVEHPQDSPDPVVLAAVDGCGVWRKEGAGSWEQVLGPETALGQQVSNRAVFAWPHGSSTVYLYDHQTGVWKSDDAGETWSMLWAHPLDESTAYDTSGYLAAPADHPGEVFVSTTDGLYEICGDQEPVQLAGVTAPGPLAYQDGTLYVAGRSTSDAPLPTLSRSTLDVDGQPGEWNDMADDTYRSMAQFPHGLAVGSDGSVYVALRGNGTVVGRPVDAEQSPP